jgi:hypothetical protein
VKQRDRNLPTRLTCFTVRFLQGIGLWIVVALGSLALILGGWIHL